MITQTENASDWAPHSLVLAPVRAVLWFLDAVPRAQEAAHTYDRLASLSDRTLAARGLTREELPYAAFRRHFEA